MPPILMFFDLKTKKRFKTNKYRVTRTKNGRLAAVATAPSGIKTFRFLPNDFKVSKGRKK